MTRFEAACEKSRQADNECLAEMFAEYFAGNIRLTDENGKQLTDKEVYEKLLRGDEK